MSLQQALAEGTLTALELAMACIDRIRLREGELRAWAWFAPDKVLEDARRLDAQFKKSGPVGALHGLPVGFKDIIDVSGIPTGNGLSGDVGRVPARDATVVARLRAAGGIVFGKTVTTEMAFLPPAVTRNPHNLKHTPGGSSSGSAAAVADGMVPLAVGTQTGGSLLRPAAFCGVTGFKPSLNAIPTDGILTLSHSLDTVGVIAQDPAGAALLAGVLGNPNTARPLERSAAAPTLGFMALPGWKQAHPALHAGFSGLRQKLGTAVIDIDVPRELAQANALAGVISSAEMAFHCRGYLDAPDVAMSSQTREYLVEGLQVSAQAYIAALQAQRALSQALAPVFQRCDAILCATAPGPAPEGLSATGSAIFNTLWTMAGMPAITLPLLRAPDGLPMGVQLVGQKGEDAALMHVAQWLWDGASQKKGPEDQRGPNEGGEASGR